MSLNFSQIQTMELAALERLKCYQKVYNRSHVSDPMATCFVFLCNSIYKDQSFLTTIHVH